MALSYSYEHLISDVRMSDYGYWVVTVAVSPWQRMSIMICSVGISPEQAIADALTTSQAAMPKKGALCPNRLSRCRNGRMVAHSVVAIRTIT